MMMAGQSTPHSLFVFDKKRTGRGRSKRKNRWAQNLHLRAGLLTYERFLNICRQRFDGLLPARAGPLSFMGLAPRLLVW